MTLLAECDRLAGNPQKKSTHHSWISLFKAPICSTEPPSTETPLSQLPEDELEVQPSCMTSFWNTFGAWASCLPKSEQWQTYWIWRARSGHHNGYHQIPTEDDPTEEDPLHVLSRKERPVSTRQPSEDSLEISGTMPDRRRFMSPEPHESTDEEPSLVADVVGALASPKCVDDVIEMELLDFMVGFARRTKVIRRG